MPYSRYALQLLKNAGIDIYTRARTSPISLRRLTPSLKLKYKAATLDKNTCGMLVHSKKGTYIFINSSHPYTRRRFSVAHEIGHYQLGHDSDVSQENDQNRWEEAQANKFASSLLMPDELLFFVHKEQSSIREMANWLRVSPISAAIRCSQLGIRRMEAEMVKDEYFFASKEIAAAKEPQINPVTNKFIEAKKNIIELLSSPAYQEQMDREYASIRKKNDRMLDKWRSAYGYE